MSCPFAVVFCSSMGLPERCLPWQKDEDATLPDFQAGDELTLQDCEAIQHFTKPTARFGEASLVKELESSASVDHPPMPALSRLFRTEGMFVWTPDAFTQRKSASWSQTG